MTQDTPGAQAKILERALKHAKDSEFNTKFQDQAPRGVALAAVGQLDEYLKEAVQMLLVPDPKVLEPMFSEMGPLGSFGARIRMGYLLGLYQNQTYNDLIHISKVRNAFAHQHAAKDFLYPEIQGHCSHIHYLKIFNKDQMSALRIHFQKQGFDVDHMAVKFLLACLILQGEVKFWAHQILAKRGRPDAIWPVLDT